MHARLVQRPAQHLASPTRFGPGWQVHQLPHLREHDVAAIARGRVAQRAEDRHLAELVIERDAAAGRGGRLDDLVRFVDARHERLLADDVGAGREAAEAVVEVAVGRRTDHDDVRLRLSQHLVELGEHGDLPRGRGTLAARRVRVDRADDGGRRHAGQCREMQRVACVAEADDRNAEMGAVGLVAQRRRRRHATRASESCGDLGAARHRRSEDVSDHCAEWRVKSDAAASEIPSRPPRGDARAAYRATQPSRVMSGLRVPDSGARRASRSRSGAPQLTRRPMAGARRASS